MNKYNFDEIIDRKNTNSIKWDYAKRRGKPTDVIPLWVADMDFKAPKEVIDALVAKVSHGIFGYSEPMDDYFDALSSWIKNHHHWEPENRKFVLTYGVVGGICALINILTKEGDGILINQPVYYPFMESIIDNKRKLINSNLVYKNNKYELDFIDLENKIKNENVKLYILCNPHNPVGRVWKKEELIKINDICKKYNVFVLSDEIHADFIYKKYIFTSYASVSDLDNAVILTAPSKTFNLAGLHNANIYIKNDLLRRKFRHELNKNGYSQSNIMGIVASQAAYKYGEEYHKELLEYLENNLDFVRNYLETKINKIKLIEPEGTYLIWLDCSGLGLTDKELNDLVLNKAKLWIDEGNIFGKIGENFIRINIATQKSLLNKALNNLYEALNNENLL